MSTCLMLCLFLRKFHGGKCRRERDWKEQRGEKREDENFKRAHSEFQYFHNLIPNMPEWTLIQSLVGTFFF